MLQGVVPTKWKQAFVVPIHKGGSHNDVRNYRPISKMSIVAKILDSIIADTLFDNFSHVISPEQHGFFKGRSTVTNLIGYTERIQRVINSGGQVDVIYTDFAKAFDKVDHTILINKLANLGVSGSLLQWFSSYLIGRTKRVQIGDALSEVTDVTSSVIQGSHCGPILFALFINDISDVLGVGFNMYADDIKLYFEVDSLDDCSVLQNNLDKLNRFTVENGLVLNAKKCFVMSYTRRTKKFVCNDYFIDGHLLERKSEIRDLGVIFDSKCTFATHVDETRKKARRTLGFIMRNAKGFSDPRTVVLLYSALTRSILEYACQVWSPSTITHIHKLESVQHKFLIYAARKFYGDFSLPLDYTKYEEKLKLRPLKHRRTICDIKFLAKSFSGGIDSSTYISLFQLHVPAPGFSGVRPKRQFHVFATTSNDTTLNRMMKSFNLHCNDYDALGGNKSLLEIITKAQKSIDEI